MKNKKTISKMGKNLIKSIPKNGLLFLGIAILCFFNIQVKAQNIMLLKDFGSDTLNLSYGSRIYNANSEIYIYRSQANTPIYKSNGVKQFTPFTSNLTDYSDLCYYNNKIIVGASSIQYGYELYETGGTNANTKLIKDINPGENSGYPGGFFTFKNKLFFIAKTNNNGVGNSLIAFDNAGKVEVIDSAYDFSSSPSNRGINNIVVSGNKIIFSRANSTGTPFLMSSDGTVSGTKIVESFNSEHINGSIYGINNFKEINGRVYFTTSNSTTETGVELYYIESATSAIRFVKDIYQGTSSSQPRGLTAHNGMCFFSADNGVNGRELWKTNGTSVGTVMVKDIIAGTNSSNPSSMVSINNWLLFTATNALGKTIIYRTDGTTAGTDTLKTNLSVDFNGSVKIGNILYFSGKDSLHGQELWQTDGTYEGTILVSDINNGTGDSGPRSFLLKNGKLYFMAYTPDKALALYVFNPACRIVSGISYVKNSETKFSFTPNSQFINGDTSTVLSYSWIFGDSTSSTDKEPSHIYTKAGSYQVRLIISVNGECFDTSTVNIEITLPNTSINNLNNAKEEILLYPNPTDAKVNISYPQHMNRLEVQVISSLGQLMFKQNINYDAVNDVIDLTPLPAGFYFIGVIDMQGKQYFKKIQKL